MSLGYLQEREYSASSVKTGSSLGLRFGDEHLNQVFGAQLKRRTQKIGESLQKITPGVKKMVV